MFLLFSVHLHFNTFCVLCTVMALTKVIENNNLYLAEFHMWLVLLTMVRGKLKSYQHKETRHFSN